MTPAPKVTLEQLGVRMPKLLVDGHRAHELVVTPLGGRLQTEEREHVARIGVGRELVVASIGPGVRVGTGHVDHMAEQVALAILRHRATEIATDAPIEQRRILQRKSFKRQSPY